MPRLTHSALQQQIAAGTLDPVYLVFGADEAEKSTVAAMFAEAVEEGLRAFNVERIYGDDRDVRAARVLDAARTLPLMVPRRIVMVFQAERLLAPKTESETADRDLELLEEYLKDPQPHATVVFVAGTLDKRRRLVALLIRRASVVECGGVEDVEEARAWVRARIAHEGITVEPAAAALIAELAGPDIARLRGDVDRVLMFAAGRKQITVADVRAVAGPATAQGEFALADFIARGDAGAALRELALVLDEGGAPVLVLGQLAWVARAKIPPSRVRAAIDAVFRTDLALKTSAGDPRVLLERLVVELCGA